MIERVVYGAREERGRVGRDVTAAAAAGAAAAAAAAAVAIAAAAHTDSVTRRRGGGESQIWHPNGNWGFK
jgi:hypothetical protein